MMRSGKFRASPDPRQLPAEFLIANRHGPVRAGRLSPSRRQGDRRLLPRRLHVGSGVAGALVIILVVRQNRTRSAEFLAETGGMGSSVLDTIQLRSIRQQIAQKGTGNVALAPTKETAR